MKVFSLPERHPKLTWILHDLSKQDEDKAVNDLKQVFLFARNELNLIKECKPIKKNGFIDWQKRKRNLSFICEGRFHARGYKG